MYEELIRRLREEPLDSNKAALPIMDLCIDAAAAIENLSHRLDMAISALRQQERFDETNKALTLDELSERNAPVFLPIKDFPNGGYWCLCENGYIIPPSGHGFMAKERPNWVFYSQKPEEGTV